VWSSTGTQLAQATFTGESASGWQRQALDTPLTLSPSQDYVISVGVNAFYVKTEYGFVSQLSNGPFASAAAANGVFAPAAGQFPDSSWHASNYFVDGVVTLPAAAQRIPQVQSATPTAGQTGVSPATSVTAKFSVPLDPSTVTTSRVTLERTSDGAAVAAAVSYDDETRTVTLNPSAPLEAGTSYTARLATGIRSDDETPMPSPVAWAFATG
jgi:hypothetical protein